MADFAAQLPDDVLLDILDTRRYGAESLNRGDDNDTDSLPPAVCACEITAGDAVTWLQYGEIPANEIALIVGDPGAGKTGYMLKIVAQKAAEGLRVLVVSEEDPAEVLRNRLEAIATGHRWDLSVVLRNVHILSLTGCQLSDVRWQLHLLAEIERTGATLVVLDPLFELVGVDEDSNVAQRPILRFLRLLIARTGSTVIVLHHFGKAGEGKRKIDRVRGASAWFGAARAVYAIEARDDGIQVECLKLSRAVRPATYVLERTVETDPENPGIWRSATYHSRTLRAADGDLAERWILEQLATAGTAPTTTELRKLALGTGLSREDLASALQRLEASGRITFDKGTRGAKHWRLTTLPGGSGKVAGSTLPTLPNVAPAGSESPAGGCPAPLRGQAPWQAGWQVEPEASQQPPPPFGLGILVPRGEPASLVEQKRRQLGELHLQRAAAVTREMDLRRAVEIVVAGMRDFGDERLLHREAVAMLAEIDRQIDILGPEIHRLDGLDLTSASIGTANES